MKRLATLGLLLTLIVPLAAQSTLPANPNLTSLFPTKPANYVTDITNTLNVSTQSTLNVRIQQLKDSSHVELAVVILPTVKDYADVDVATEIGRRWGVGVRAEVGNENRNNGLVLLLVPKTPASNNTGHCFLAVGNGMEGRITDARAASVCNNTIIPYLRRNDWNGGVTAGVNKIIQLSLQTIPTPKTTSPRAPTPPIPFGVWATITLFILGGLIWYLVWKVKDNERRAIEEAKQRAIDAVRLAERLKHEAELRKVEAIRIRRAKEAEEKRWNALTPAQQKAELEETERLRLIAVAAAALAAKKRRKDEEEEEAERRRRRNTYDDDDSSSSSRGSYGGSYGGGGGSSFGGFGGGGGFSGGGGGGKW